MENKTKTLYYGDNLEILRNKIPDNSIDLCYIDPPFNSKKNYFQIYNNIGGKEDKAQSQAFVDTWKWNESAESGYSEITTNQNGRFTRQTIELINGLHCILGKSDLLAYLVSMTLRITEIYRVLKPTGSFYLHCDPTASHYLKLILDAVFCSQSGDFKNEIVWSYRTGGVSKKYFPKKHDIIFFYTKSRKYNFNPQQERIYYEKPFFITDVDEQGRYYADVYIRDVWDIQAVINVSKERLGYPTQKPEALLERIIQASSNPGDVVLDAYCGCGTTVAVAERLNRNWIGIDITYHSISLILKRLTDSNNGKLPEDIIVDGIPQDLESARALANRSDDYVRKEFEKWAVLTYSNNRAVINDKRGADGGIDGMVYFAVGSGKTERLVFQVKSGHVNRATIATLSADMKNNNAQMAVLLTLEEPTKPMIENAVSNGFYYHPLMQREYPKVSIVTIREIIEENKTLDMPLSFDVVKSAQKTKKDSGQLDIGFDD